VITHTFNPVTQDVKVGGYLWVQGHHGLHYQDPGHLELHRETPSKKQKTPNQPPQNLCFHFFFFLFFFFLKIYLFYLYEYILAVFRHQRRASDPITDGCEPPCGCWDLNSGPLEEQLVLLTAEPSLQPRLPFLKSFRSQKHEVHVGYLVTLQNLKKRLYCWRYHILES
jgi:hypothetical protein